MNLYKYPGEALPRVHLYYILMFGHKQINQGKKDKTWAVYDIKQIAHIPHVLNEGIGFFEDSSSFADLFICWRCKQILDRIFHRKC